jgi:hypothetical protein
MKIKISLFLLSLALFSCFGGKSKEEKQKEQKEKFDMEQQERRQKRINTLADIGKPYGATVSFDTADFTMTYEYQELLKSNNTIVTGNFEVADISIMDSLYILSGTTHNMFYDLKASKKLVDKIKTTLVADEDNKNRHYIVATITSIGKPNFKFDAEGENNGEDAPDTWIEVDVSDLFYCKGNLLDFVSVENK